jgi:type I restriction enzyme S subunit
MSTLKPYPAYKPVAVPWLQQVPEHWEVSPGLAHLRFKQEKNTGMVVKQVLSLSYGRIVIKPKEKLTGLVPESFETYQIVGPGDIIVRATDLQNDRTSLRIGEVKDRGIITSAYLCLNVHNGMVPSFGYYLIHAYDLMKVLYGFGSGLRQNLDWKDFKRMPLAVPPPAEQHLIVRYLHAMDAKVKRYIRTKRSLIARLQEQKQAIIQRAVTRGLDPNVKLKPSGVEWLGEVPVHWEVRRSKTLFSERKERSRPDDIQLSATQAYGVIAQDDFEARVGRRVVKLMMHLDKRKHVELNDFVISMRSFQGGLERAWAQGAIRSSYVILKPGPEVDVDYFTYLLKAPGYIKALQSTADFIRDGQDLNYTDFSRVSLPLPPQNEQRVIAESIKSGLIGIERTIDKVVGEVSLLQEYHTRLIADVVTGAVDVREAARKLSALDQTMSGSEDQTLEEDMALEEEQNADEQV